MRKFDGGFCGFYRSEMNRFSLKRSNRTPKEKKYIEATIFLQIRIATKLRRRYLFASDG